VWIIAYRNPPKISDKPLYNHLHPDFLSHLLKQQEDSDVILASLSKIYSLIQVITTPK
jgi:hypothetical protein